MTDLRTLADSLFGGDAAAARDILSQTGAVDDQRLGRLSGRSGLDDWLENSIVWAQELKASASVVTSLCSKNRAVLELSLDIDSGDGVVDLPFVFVADLDEGAPDGGSIVELRTYHSTWPYTGSHVFRAPPLEGESRDPIPAIFARYIDQVTQADVAAVQESFTVDGYLREPSGNRWKHQGVEERGKFYGHLESAPKTAFVLNACLEDDSAIAVEYSFAYGDVPMVGGICIMELEADRIAAVRIADDVGA